MATATAVTGSPSSLGIRPAADSVDSGDKPSQSTAKNVAPGSDLPSRYPEGGPRKAFDNARKRTLGEDILNPKRVIPTMGEAFDQYIADHTPEWKRRGKHRAKDLEYKWKSSKRYCKSILSKRDLSRHPR